MKIIHLVLGKANPNRMNGVNKVVHQLASTQQAAGKETSVWGIANDLEHNYPSRNFHTQLFQQRKNKCVCPHLKTAIKELSKEHIIHIHGAFILEFVQVARLLIQQKIPYLYTPHGSFASAAMEKNKWVKRIYFHVFEKHLIKQAKAVQLLGINEFNHLDKLGFFPNKVLIPNGIAYKKIPNASSLTKEKKQLIFGFCGRLDTNHKGLDLLLKGFQLYRIQGGSATLELIGDGEDKNDLEQLARQLNIHQQIFFHGALFGLKKFQILKQFNAFFHTSRMEGFPMAVLEAAALSTPCVTSKATNISSYIRNNQAGIALQTNTPQRIATAMHSCEQYHQNKQLHLLGKNARKMIERSFSWDNIAQQLEKVYAA